MSDLVTRFAALFEGNKTAYGLAHGECVKDGDAPFEWAYLWRDHLGGGTPIGVYPMTYRTIGQGQVGDDNAAGWTVKWGCVDFDVKVEGKSRYDYETPEAAHEAAVNFVTALKVLGIVGWIERTKSDGRHVWVFAQSWVPAVVMRKALLVACSLAHVPPTEVNPKSWSLQEGQLGNYVNLPYPGWARVATTIHRFRYIIDPLTDDAWGVKRLAEWLWEAELALVPSAVLTEISHLHVPAAAESRGELELHDVEMDSAIYARLRPLARLMWDEGPLGADRSAFLFKMAAKATESGLDASESLALVKAADEKWCQKFTHRADAERRYLEIIERTR